MRSKFQVSIFNFQFSILLCCSMLLAVSCKQTFTPKPEAYFRIDFPDKEYQLYDGICPFTFEYPVYGELVAIDSYSVSEPCWYSIFFPSFKGTIHLTYKEIDDNFDNFIEDNWRMIYSRIAQRADAVDEREYENSEINVYGMIFNIRGNAASSVQFFVTDSVRNFLRGSLYFNVRPNADSLAPAIDFFREDVIHLIETLEWKN